MRRPANRHVPMRRCVLCRESLPQRELVRLATVNGALRLDPKRTLGGRGTWVCAPCAAERNPKRLRQAFRGQAEAVADLLENAALTPTGSASNVTGAKVTTSHTNNAPRRIRVERAPTTPKR